VSEDLAGCVQVFVEWLPNKFHGFFNCSFFKVLEIESRKEPCIKPHICKQPWISIRMAEGINMPSYPRGNSEFLLKPVVSKVHVVYYIFIMSTCFIVHTPSSVDDFKTTLLIEHTNFVFHVFSLSLPPHTEELHFNVCELFGRI
jgi:hypothetical protein